MRPAAPTDLRPTVSVIPDARDPREPAVPGGATAPADRGVAPCGTHAAPLRDIGGVPLSVRHVTVERGEVRALQDVDLDLAAGAVTLLCGGNGSGKSTLLLALAGVLPLTSGSIDGLGGQKGARLALVPQVPPVPQRLPLTVGAAVGMGRWADLGLFRRPRRRDREIVAQRLALLGLDELAERQLSEVSGGQRQRALVAQALVREAPVLLLDEPTAAADSASSELIHRAARLEADRGATVVMATHDPAAREFADVVVTLDAGRVLDVERAPAPRMS